MPTCTEKHYLNFRHNGTRDSDGEASSVIVESGRASPAAADSTFISSVNVTTPYCNGIMSARVCYRRRDTTRGSYCIADVERTRVPVRDSTLSHTLSRMLKKLDATELEAMNQLRLFVNCQTRLLHDLGRSCESAFRSM